MIALTFVSHLDEDTFRKILNDTRSAYNVLRNTNAALQFPPFRNPHYMVMDGDSAEWNAVQHCFPTTIKLMCWFHVMKNCREELVGISLAEKEGKPV